LPSERGVTDRALFPEHSFDRAKRLLGGALVHLATRD